MDSMKRQKDTKLEDEHPRLEGVQYATREELRAITNSSSKNVVAGPKHQGIFPTQGSNPCFLSLLLWHAGSLPLYLSLIFTFHDCILSLFSYLYLQTFCLILSQKKNILDS